MHMHKRSDKISIQIEKLGLITLISALAIALVSTIWSVYAESIIKDASEVGLINTLFGIIGVIGFIIFIPFIEKNSKTRILGITLITYSLSYFLFLKFSSEIAIIILGAIIYLSGSLRINTLGIILRDKSKSKSVSRNTGFMYTMLNLSWLIAPIIAGFLSQKFGFKAVFLISGILMILAYILFKLSKIEDNRTTKKIDKNPLKISKDFFSNKKFIINYIISGGISFWWAFIYIFIPIYIIESGKTNLTLGYFLAGVVVPLILLELYFAKIAAKSGFKKMFFIGYLILTISAIVCFLINNLYARLGLLIIGSIGIAMIESTSEAYFFDITSQKERDKFYGVYNTTIYINYAISAGIISILIKFLQFKYSFLVISLFMLFFTLISLKAKNIIESRRK